MSKNYSTVQTETYTKRSNKNGKSSITIKSLGKNIDENGNESTIYKYIDDKGSQLMVYAPSQKFINITDGQNVKTIYKKDKPEDYRYYQDLLQQISKNYGEIPGGYDDIIVYPSKKLQSGGIIPQWGLNFISRYEDFRPEAYWDSIGKVWTIGFGSTKHLNGKAVKKGDKLSEKEAQQYLSKYINKSYAELKKVFPEFDKFPEQFKVALFDMAYRGGGMNLKRKSPNFVNAVNKAFKNGQFSKQDINNIVSNIETSNKSGNLKDRFERRIAMLYGVYNPDDNRTINTATTQKSRYSNIRNNINYPGNMAYQVYHMNNSGAPFAVRLQEGMDRQTIPDWENKGKVTTHKLGYVTESNDNGEYAVVYPSVQEEPDYPWWDIFKLTTPDKELIDYSNPKYSKDFALERAIEKGDTIHVPIDMAKPLTQKYKEWYQFNYKKGGKLDYIKLYNKK